MGGSVGLSRRPLRYDRSAADVEDAFAALRASIRTSGLSGRAVAESAGMGPAVLSKFLRPQQYQSRRDWSQVSAVLRAVDADVDDFARAHGHLWDVRAPDPDADRADETSAPADQAERAGSAALPPPAAPDLDPAGAPDLRVPEPSTPEPRSNLSAILDMAIHSACPVPGGLSNMGRRDLAEVVNVLFDEGENLSSDIWRGSDYLQCPFDAPSLFFCLGMHGLARILENHVSLIEV